MELLSSHEPQNTALCWSPHDDQKSSLFYFTYINPCVFGSHPLIQAQCQHLHNLLVKHYEK